MSKKSHKALASATVMSLILTSTLTATTVSAAASVERLEGAGREATAASVAKKAFAEAKTVVLVNGYGYGDAVSATPLAKALGAPILLTNKVNEPTAELLATLKDLKAEKIVIVGGTGVVTPALESKLGETYKVERIGGASRYETNANVAKEVLKLTGKKEAFLVNGQDGYADALSVASIAATKGAPVLFGNKNEVPAVVKAVAEGLTVSAVGGTAVLPSSVINSVDATRVASGADRFATNLEVLKKYKDDLKFDNIYMAFGGATAVQFADALVASAAAAKTGAPVVLSGSKNADTFTANAKTYVKDNFKAETKVYLVGGTGSLEAAIEKAVKDIVDPQGVVLVDTVEAKADAIFNAKVSGQRLGFTINKGREVSIEQLDEAGYEIEFQASETIFDGKVKTSKTGVVDKTELAAILTAATATSKSFSYKVVIIKDGIVVAESDYVKATIVDGEETASTINSYKLEDKTDSYKITSGKLVVGQTVDIKDVKGDLVDGRKNVKFTNLEYSTSNAFVAEVSSAGVITAKAPGTFTLTIKSGNAKKDISLTVVNEARIATKATADVASVNIAKTGVTSFDIKLVDQFGDAFVGTSATDYTVTANIEDSKGTTIATVGEETPAKTSTSGKAKLTVTGVLEGKGNIVISKASGAKMLTIPVTISANTIVNSVKAEAADADSKNLTIDLNPEDGNDEIALVLNQYTSNGSLVGADLTVVDTMTSGKYAARVINPAGKNILASIVAATDINATTGIVTIKPAGDIGTASVVFEDEHGTVKATVKITVKDTSPTISSVTFVSDVEIDNAAFALDEIVYPENIKLNGSGGDGRVRIEDDGTIWIDATDDATTTYQVGEDILLGNIVVVKKSGTITFGTPAISSGNVVTTAGDDGVITIGIVKAHDKLPSFTKDVKVKH